MQMLYNSDNFAVVQFDVPVDEQSAATGGREVRGGYEIVDKHNRREIYLDGVLAVRFRQDVEALISRSPSEEDVDEFLEGFSGMAQQPVILH